MSETIAEAVLTLRRGVLTSALDEAKAKQSIVLRLLSLCGWDIFEDIVPEYTVGGRRVDYALRTGSTNRAFVEVKRPSEDLEDHQRQLLDYCFQEGVRLATLTNGRTWWLYLPLREGSWEQRRFLTIDLESQEPGVIESRFMQFLSKDKVASGSAVEEAEELLRSQQRIDTIRGALGQAWSEIVEGPDELLVDLLSETTERICGFKPDNEAVEDFLRQWQSGVQSRPLAPTTPPPSRAQSPREGTAPPRRYQRQGFTGKRPSSFVYQGEEHRVSTWAEVLLGVCNLAFRQQGSNFTRVLDLRGRKRPYFSRDGGELRQPRLLDAGFYVESNLSANSIASLCRDVTRMFDHGDADVDIRLAE